MKTECRPFRLSDAMILIAALGVGFGLLAFSLRLDPHAVFPINFSSFLSFVGSICFDAVQVIPPLAAPLTAAILVLGLRRPRLPLRRLRRSPGLVGCFVALVFLTLGGAVTTIGAASQHRFFSGTLLEFIFDVLNNAPASEVGLWVFITWTTLLISGCWRPSPCWLDRLGRGLGAFWIAAYFCRQTHEILFPWHD
jgi:hypothetical protein